MNVVVFGLRGFPGVQGGIESHAQNLYPRLVRMGCQVEVFARHRYIKPGFAAWEGVRFTSIWAPGERIAGLESLVHSFLCACLAGFRRPDILHIHGIGPGIFTPMAKALGIKTVVTHHGHDYNREKWGGAGRFVLRAGEHLAARFGCEIISISKEISKLIETKYKRKSLVIENGVNIPDLSESYDEIKKFGLLPGKYILNVGRIVPEKRQIDLIEAFKKVKLKDWKLVLVGGLYPETQYVTSLKMRAAKDDSVVLTGFQTGKSLQELYSNAGVFVLPSSHEGLPIALLEALSYGLPVLASDIPGNKEVGLEETHYFRLGDLSSLSDGLWRLCGVRYELSKKEDIRRWISRRYSWDSAASKTLEVYKRCLAR